MSEKETLMKTPMVEQLAHYAVALRYEDIPESARTTARQLVFDTIGTALGGYQTELGQRAVAYAISALPGHEAQLIGDGRYSSAEGAAFANSVMAKILGMDDSHRTAGHIAAIVIPVLFAVAGSKALNGRDLITALVAAYDVAIRLGSHVRYEQRRRGLDLKGTVTPIVGALAAGRYLGLDATMIAQAMALAADMASGTEQYVYEGGACDTKDLVAGFAARNAVSAVRLAMAGFRGPRGALDGEYGFLQAFGPGKESAAGLFDDLGTCFRISETAFKPHGGCRHTHQAVDAVQRMLADGPIDLEQIESIDLYTYAYALQPHFRIDPDPEGRATAGLSIRVATALALVRGSTFPADYQAWDDPIVRRLRHSMSVHVDEQIEAVYPQRNGCTIHVRLRDGSQRSGSVLFARGEPEAALSDADLFAKVHALARPIRSPETIQDLAQMCANLEQLSSSDQIFACRDVSESVLHT
jgi:2-methylcitrate dehydratase PrpD